jgi:hypothetical protein
MAKIIWKGDQVIAKVQADTELAIDKTMAECVREGKANHGTYPPASDPGEKYANRTAHEVGAIQIIEPAATDPDFRKVGGKWGSLSNVSLYLEIGTSIEGENAFEREQAAEGNMNAVTPPIGPLMAPRPTLRPAADVQYPLLRSRIAAARRGQEMP